MNANSKPRALTLSSWVQSATSRLAEKHIPTAQLDAEVLLTSYLDKNRSWLVTHDNEILSTDQLRSLEHRLKRRLTREPVAYITGKKEFYGREFAVTPAVLIPRPETEDLIELALAQKLSGTLIDVGCGSGCIGITLALEVPGLDVILSDISQEALAVAEKNAHTLGVAHIRTTQSDLLSHWIGKTSAKPFSAITANLPYVNPDWTRSPETDHEPALALFAEDNGCALIIKLLRQAPSLLAPNGFLFLEADPEQHRRIIEEAVTVGFSHVAMKGYALAFQLAVASDR